MNINLCPAGLTLLRQTIAGTASIYFQGLQLGNGADAGDEATALSNPMMSLSLTSATVGDVFITLHTAFTNAEVESGFRATEIGVIASDGENGEPILYAYLYAGDSGDYIPAAADRTLESSYDVAAYIGEAENVSAAISSSLEYCTKQEFEAFCARRDNPHEVTAEQVGLGNVANKAENDIAPTWETTHELAGINSGETLAEICAKLACAVQDLIVHLNSNTNPHAVTAAQTGAAPTSHTHGASAITDGVLGPARGGTGQNTLKGAALAMFAAIADLPTAKYADLDLYLEDGFWRVRSSDAHNPIGKDGYLLSFLAGKASNSSGVITMRNYTQIYLCTAALAVGEQKVYTRSAQTNGIISSWC